MNQSQAFYYNMQFVIVFIICCHFKLGSSGISEQMCDEYAEAVNAASPVVVGRRKVSTESTCGIVATPLIVGGTKAGEREFPHMALIGFGNGPDAELKWHCGGSLISDLYVLTAAHCTESREQGPARRARFGTLQIDNHGEDLQEKRIKRSIRHPDYKPPSKYNDIALLELESPVEFTPDVRPACLNVMDIPNDADVIASGFGKIAYDAVSESSGDLMKVQLKTISSDVCTNLIGARAKYILKDGITESIICAGELAGGKDTCQGDSGGPLQIVRREPYCMYGIVGVTSFGMFCGFQNSPAMYTNVSYYVPWIEKIVWG